MTEKPVSYPPHFKPKARSADFNLSRPREANSYIYKKNQVTTILFKEILTNNERSNLGLRRQVAQVFPKLGHTCTFHSPPPGVRLTLSEGLTDSVDKFINNHTGSVP